MLAEPHRSVLDVAVRVAVMAVGALFLAVLLALLAPGSDTAHAADDGALPTEPRPAASAALWAEPDDVGAAALRRAGDRDPVVIAVDRAPATQAPDAGDRPSPARPAAPATPTARAVLAASASASMSTSALGGSAPPAGPSMAQLAILSAAIGMALWMSQRLLATELHWRSTMLIAGFERPG